MVAGLVLAGGMNRSRARLTASERSLRYFWTSTLFNEPARAADAGILQPFSNPARTGKPEGGFLQEPGASKTVNGRPTEANQCEVNRSSRRERRAAGGESRAGQPLLSSLPWCAVCTAI